LAFVEQFYNSATFVPPLILLQYPVNESEELEKWLSTRRSKPVHIKVPRRGAKKQLVDQVVENARQGLELLKIKQLTAPGLPPPQCLRYKKP